MFGWIKFDPSGRWLALFLLNLMIITKPAAATPVNQVFATSYNASGSGQTTTGTIAASSTTLTLAGALDFANGQGIRIDRAGPAFSSGASTISSAVVNGTAGSTTYAYKIASIDYNGGVATSTAATTVATGNATLSTANNVTLTIVQGSGASGYAIWKSTNAGAYVYIGPGQGSKFVDTGFVPASRPEQIPALPPSSALPDWLVTTITSGAGTTTLTLANAAGTAKANTPVFHDDTAALQAAVNANTTMGAEIIIPCGIYNVTNTVSVSNSYVGFTGQGQCTQISGYGAGNDFQFNIGGSAFIRGNFVDSLYMPSYNKTAGMPIYANFVQTFDLTKVVVDHPWTGAWFHNVNDVRINHFRVYNFYGTGAWFLRVDSDATNYACCVFMSDLYGTGNAKPGGVGGGGLDKVGFYFDGNVATIQGHSVAVSNIEGDSLLALNDVGNPASPQFFELFDFDAEFPNGRNVNLIAGSRIYFTTPNVHGARADHNIVVGQNVFTVGFVNGFSTGAKCSGLLTAGSQVSIVGMDFAGNSTPNSGGTAGGCSAIDIASTSVGTTVTGNKAGDPLNPTWQKYGIQIDSGANHFVVNGNELYGNANAGVLNNAGTSATQIVSNNAN